LSTLYEYSIWLFLLVPYDRPWTDLRVALEERHGLSDSKKAIEVDLLICQTLKCLEVLSLGLGLAELSTWLRIRPIKSVELYLYLLG